MKFQKPDVKKVLNSFHSFPKKVSESFFVQDGEKRKLNLKLMGLVLIPLILAGSFLGIFSESKDTSYLNQSSGKVESDKQLDAPSMPMEKPLASYSTIIREQVEANTARTKRFTKELAPLIS